MFIGSMAGVLFVGTFLIVRLVGYVPDGEPFWPESFRRAGRRVNQWLQIIRVGAVVFVTLVGRRM